MRHYRREKRAKAARFNNSTEMMRFMLHGIPQKKVWTLQKGVRPAEEERLYWAAKN
jgi:hypothetical protein